MTFADHLRKLRIEEKTIDRIMTVEYPHDEQHPKQDTANFMAAALRRCESDLDFDTISAVMFDRACCKSGSRLKDVRQIAKEHGSKTLAEKLSILGQVRYMGHPFINADGDIESNAVEKYAGVRMTCPCWHLAGATPVNGPMPLAYCQCCAGHFQFHYQIALGMPLRLKRVVSSILNSEGLSPCVFVYEIRNKMPMTVKS